MFQVASLRLFRRCCSQEKLPDCIVKNLYDSDVYPLTMTVNKEKLFNYHYNFVHNLSMEGMDLKVGVTSSATENETLLLDETKNAHDLSNFDSTTTGMYESVSEKLYFLRSNWRKMSEEEKKLLRRLGCSHTEIPVKISPFENIQPKSTPFPLSLVPRMVEYVATPIELMDMDGPLKRILREELSKHGSEAFERLVTKGWLKNTPTHSVNLNYIHYHYVRKQLEDIDMSREKKDPELLKDTFLDFYHEYINNSCYRDVEGYISKCILNDPLKMKQYKLARTTIMKQMPHWSDWKKVNWEALQYSNVDKSQLEASRRLYRSLLIGDLMLFDMKLFVDKFIQSIKNMMRKQFGNGSSGLSLPTVDTIDPVKFSIDNGLCKFWIEANCFIEFPLKGLAYKSSGVTSPLKLSNHTIIKTLPSILTRFCIKLYRSYLKSDRLNKIKVQSISNMIDWAIGEVALIYYARSKNNTEKLVNLDQLSIRNYFRFDLEMSLENVCYLNRDNLVKFLTDSSNSDLSDKFLTSPVTDNHIMVDKRLLGTENFEYTKVSLLNSLVEHQLFKYIHRRAFGFYRKWYKDKSFRRKIKLQTMRNIDRRNKRLKEWLFVIGIDCK